MLNLLTLLVVTSLAFSPTLSQSPMVVALPRVAMYQSDVINFKYVSEGHVSVLSSESSALSVEKMEHFDGVLYTGYVAIWLKPLNKTIDDELVVAFYSAQPYTVNISLTQASMKKFVDLGAYTCPANVTVEFVVPFTYVAFAATERYGEEPLGAALSFESPLWRLVVYGVLLSMFSASWWLDSKDYRVKKGKRWARQDSLALLIRYLFYGSALSVIAVAVMTLAQLMYGYFVSGVVNLSLGGMIEASCIFAFLAVLYWIAKWRDWFDVVDEEE